MIDEVDLKTTTHRLTPAGGMIAGMPPQIVRVVHIPTGLAAECSHYRSQHKNRKQCIHMLEEALTNPV